ncbi:hypothetical protein AND_003096 [Anopheles darlingi]|uniref:Uncharacterized protein n=1 Tax=Anopheles darlingi TaxID=43151 RepID=W5JP96_ANODA|nr:hypothetical protein AND_003096 [Anopheles darlingi]
MITVEETSLRRERRSEQRSAALSILCGDDVAFHHVLCFIMSIVECWNMLHPYEKHPQALRQ